MEKIINQAITAHQEGRLEEAELLYRSILKIYPGHFIILNNLSIILQHYSKFDEAEKNIKKAIELKPDYAEAHNNLGAVLRDLGRLDEVETSFRKAIELKPDYAEAHNNLDVLLKEKYLLDYICETKKIYKKNKVSSVDSSVGLTSNPFITHRNVETKLLKDLYKSELIELDKIKDARYGNGRCSDFKFLESDFPIIKNIKEDLIKIIRSAVKSDVFIFSSFLNIYGPGSGAIPHNHIRNFDKNQGLINQKYSLTYYLSVGDQNCSEPGNLQLYDPFEEIKLSDGTIVIIPATKKHGAVYGGKTDRIMIGINFYSVL